MLNTQHRHTIFGLIFCYVSRMHECNVSEHVLLRKLCDYSKTCGRMTSIFGQQELFIVAKILFTLFLFSASCTSRIWFDWTQRRLNVKTTKRKSKAELRRSRPFPIYSSCFSLINKPSGRVDVTTGVFVTANTHF